MLRILLLALVITVFSTVTALAASTGQNTMVILRTSEGDIRLELFADKAPQTVANFQKLVDEGFYDGVVFHRVIDGFMIQTGGFEPGMVPKENRDSIDNEADNGLSNLKGTLAMARTLDPHSASTQFFVNVADNNFLDHSAKTAEGWGYAVFGQVIEGMDVVNKIKAVNTTFKAGHQDVPSEEILIESASLVSDS